MGGRGANSEREGSGVSWLGITGRAGAGKDHLAKVLTRKSEDFVVLSFAGQLRLEIENVLGVDSAPALWEKPTHPDIRRLLQWWGTDLRRAEDPDYWVKKGIEVGLKYASNEFIPIYTDVRFPNEANAIKEQGGLIIRVVASDDERIKRLGELPPEHLSETAMDDYEVDMTVYSDRTDEDYKAQVDSVVAAVRGVRSAS